MPRNASNAAPLSPALLAAAPHRLLFFTGAANVLLAMAWWLAWLADARWSAIGLPQAPAFAGWMHAVIMQYQVLPPFMFGFLLTVFPRWMGLPELRRAHYVPVGAGLLGGQLLTLAGIAAGRDMPLHLGWVLTILGWSYGLLQLGRVLLAERRAGRGPTWHALSCFGALLLGLLGLLCVAVFLHTGNPWLMFVAIKLGTFGLLLPIYLTVAHRMFPFFAGNVVAGYRPWRPLWLLVPAWALLLAHLALELTHAYAWLWLVDLPLALGTAAVLWRWWPRAAAPGLLWVLFVGFAWLPLAMVLYATQAVIYQLTGEFALGRAPVHALSVGFFGSVLVAMVTRVTQGHSGRPLAMTGVAWFAFAVVQLAAIVRIASEVAGAAVLEWQVAAVALWLLAFAPWVLRNLGIYLRARSDGRAG